MNATDEGYLPKQAKELEPGDSFLDPGFIERRVLGRMQHPLVGRMLTITTDGPTWNYVKTAQVWVR